MKRAASHPDHFGNAWSVKATTAMARKNAVPADAAGASQYEPCRSAGCMHGGAIYQMSAHGTHRQVHDSTRRPLNGGPGVRRALR